MIQPTIEPLSLSDGYLAAARWWRGNDSRGAVLYFHGIQSHGGWYEDSGGRLAEAGLTVLMPDRRGSGLNHDQRGHVDSMDRAVADASDALDALLRETRRSSAMQHNQPEAQTREPMDSKAHVVGVSWGGKLAVCLAAHRPEQVASLTLIAPGLFPRVDLSSTDKFRVGLSLINHRDRRFDIPLNDPGFFTANPERIRYVQQDPLMLRQVTATFLLATRRMDRVVARFGRGSHGAQSPSAVFRGPVHLMLAGHDRIIENDRTRAWLRALPSPDRQITEYPEAHHTIEFEPDPSTFYTDLVEWIAHRSTK